MKFLATTAAALLALSETALAGSHVFEVVPGQGAVPQGWTKIGIPDQATRIHLRIAMKHPDPDWMERALMDVSDPESRNYGKHLKRDEVKAMLKPRASASTAVLDWLSASGIEERDIEDDGEYINFWTTISKANKMLDTEFATYSNTADQTRIRTLSYSLPEELHQHVDMVQPTTRFGQVRPQRSWVLDVEQSTIPSAPLNTTACNATITPACLRALYNVDGYKGQSSGGDFIGINNFLNEYPRYADLAKFEATYAPYANGKNFSWVSIAGGKLDQDSSDDSVEANLDMQYVAAMSYDVPILAYSTGGLGPLVPDLDQPNQPGQNEPYLDFLNYIIKLPDNKLPKTLTTSYGEDEQSVPEAYSRQVCNMFGQLGLRGVSVLFSSGDTGVGSACQTNDGLNTTRFLPIFPAACPYLTSVGGTYKVEPERAIAFSSGGFSDRFARPVYQDKAVSAYLKLLGPRWAGLYNPNGRGFPDVAAQSYRFHVINGGSDILVGGTSASAPTFAGIVALLNSARVGAGLPGLGFLNPFIYSQGYKALNDITVGGSRGCTGTDQYSGLPTPYVPYASWNATVGWDPVTGYGTPDFQKLLALVVPKPKWGYGGGWGWHWQS